ncbi:hypothetical protein RsoM2USA_93 [Ralstonia phage RsoM2USA]|nr:hypothetical protein RsoM2USA_93 [Ralstonia phage RsoM2USA]
MHWEPEFFARFRNTKDSRHFAEIHHTPGDQHQYRVTYMLMGAHGNGVVKMNGVNHLSEAITRLTESGYQRE